MQHSSTPLGLRLRRLREEFFPDVVTGFFTILAVLGGAIGFFGAYAGAFDLVHRYAQEYVIASFVWVTYLTNCVLLATLYAIHRAIVVDRATRAVEQANRRTREESTIQSHVLAHKMSEQVRARAKELENGNSYNMQAELQHVLGEGIRGYLTARLGQKNGFSITVKQVVEGTDQLRVVFRDQGQDPNVRPTGELEPLADCYIYKRFVATDGASSVAPSEWVLVRDTTRVDEAFGGAIKARAAKRGYKSTIAFPIRVLAPFETPVTRVASLIGLLCVDSPERNAFDGLFACIDGAQEDVVHGEHFRELTEMHLFFALADSLATIFVLGGIKVANHPSDPVKEGGR